MITINTNRLAARSATAVLVASLWGCGAAPVAMPRPVVLTETSQNTMREPAMTEFLDPMSQDAAADIANQLPLVSTIASQPTRLVFVVPQTLNIQGQIPDLRIQQALANIRIQLQSNAAFNRRFLVLNSTEAQSTQTARAIQGDAAEFRDPLQESADPTAPTRYAPASMYTMTGHMYLANDPQSHRKQLNFTVEVSSLLDRTPIVTKHIIYNLLWDSQQGRWVKDS